MEARIIRAIAVLISSEAGHSVDLFGLRAYRLEDGRYAVAGDLEDGEKLFKSALKAAKYFEKLRGKKKIGFDYEGDR